MIQAVKAQYNLAIEFPDISRMTLIARELKDGTSGSVAWNKKRLSAVAKQELITELKQEMQPLFVFLEKYFDPRRAEQVVDFNLAKLTEIEQLATAYNKYDTNFGERLPIFFDLMRLQQLAILQQEAIDQQNVIVRKMADGQGIVNTAPNTSFMNDYQHILDRLSRNLSALLIDNGSYSTPVSSERDIGVNGYEELAKTKGPRDYMALRSRIGQLVASGFLDIKIVVDHYQNKVGKVHNSLPWLSIDEYFSTIKSQREMKRNGTVDSSSKTDFSNTILLDGFNDATQLVRAVMKDLSPEDRSKTRDMIKKASKVLLRETRIRHTHDDNVVRKELRGFFKSLHLPSQLAKHIHGGFLETAVHSIDRYSFGLGMTEAAKRNGIAGLTLFGAGLLLKVSSNGGDMLMAGAGGVLSVGVIGAHIGLLKQRLSVVSQNYDARRPNAPILFSRCVDKFPKIVPNIDDNVTSTLANGFGIIERAKKYYESSYLSRYKREVDRVERFAKDLSSISINVPPAVEKMPPPRHLTSIPNPVI